MRDNDALDQAIKSGAYDTGVQVWPSRQSVTDAIKYLGRVTFGTTVRHQCCDSVELVRFDADPLLSLPENESAFAATLVAAYRKHACRIA